MTTSPRAARSLAVFMAAAGTGHFLVPKPLDAIVPEQLPGSARTWTYISGLAELACAAAIAHPRTRRRGALATAALFVAVFPANVKMAIDWRDKPLPLRAAAFGRLPLQAPLVVWALKAAKDHKG
ncbi:DoxX family protein [Spirillospora sp. CA-294931]|uniref:DoxX family protein n=1 Tax=Spirillospora sp. CA-294931 TaxID=3240042 RepID=UPI003D8B2678